MAWSRNAGKRGVNWVRVFEDPRRGTLNLEWMEIVTDGEGRAVLDERGRPKKRRARLQLDHTDRRRAFDEAKELSERFAAIESGPITVHRLIDQYIAHVTPGKGESKQDHDRRAGRLFKALVPPTQPAASLDRGEWDGFITKRRAGTLLDGFGPVRDRQVGYDLKFMIAVLGWGVGTKKLASHPWGPEIRRTQGWKMPVERTPHQPKMTPEIRSMLAAHSTDWRMELALAFGGETWSRNISVRLLQWADIDFADETIRWRREKDGGDYTTPLSAHALHLLRTAPSRGIGQAWVFPMVTDPSRPCTRHAMQRLLKLAKRRLLASIEDPEERARMRERLRGLGYHGEKRAAVRDPEFRKLPRKEREALARTTGVVLDNVYDRVELDEMRAAMRQVKGRRSAG